ncbi:MAG: hypothetical protein ACFNKE_06530, partial [Neisseria elongata]
HVFTDNTPIEVAPGVELIGAPWHSKTPSCDLVSHAIAGLEPAGAPAAPTAHAWAGARLSTVQTSTRTGQTDTQPVTITPAAQYVTRSGCPTCSFICAAARAA